MTTKYDRRKKKTGPLIAAAVMVVLMGWLIALVLWANAVEPAPWWILALVLVIFAGIIVGVLLRCWNECGKSTEEKRMKLYNIDYIPGAEIEALGLVRGTVVYSKNFGKDFMAGMKTLVGGEIVGYTEMLTEARAIATKRMVDDAEALGADAVVNIRYGSASIMSGAAEVVAYGTAVRIKV